MTRFTISLVALVAWLGVGGLAPVTGASAATGHAGMAAQRSDTIGQQTPAAGGPKTWHVLVGGHTEGQAIQAEGYYPHVITIDAGDTVVWTLNTGEIHAVAFTGTCTDINSCFPPCYFTVNPDISPCGSPTYDGVSGWDSSGRMVPGGYNWDNSVPRGGTTFSLTFTKPGTDVYFDLSYAGMRGVVVVNPAGTPYPFTQAQYSAQAREQLAADLAAGARARRGSQPATTDRGGTHAHRVAVGASSPEKAKVALATAGSSAAQGRALLTEPGAGASPNPAITVRIRLSHLAPGSVHAVQILPGVCGAPAPTTGLIFSQLFAPPAFTLNSVTARPNGKATSTTVLTAPPNFNGPGQLRIPSSGWFINVAGGPTPDNGTTSTACGNIVFHAASVMRYFPQNLHVHVGDTVVWANATSEVHGVTFLAGQPLPPIPGWYDSSPT